MIRIVYLFLLLGILLFYPIQVQAEPPTPLVYTKIKVLPDYYEKVQALCANFICNHKVKTDMKGWDPWKYDVKKIFPRYCEDIFGTDVWIGTSSTKRGGGAKGDCAVYMDADSAYYLMRDSKSSPYTFTNRQINWKDPEGYLSRFYGFHAVSSQVYFFDSSNKHVRTDTVDFEGRKAIKMEFVATQNQPVTVYLDKESYQFLYSEIIRPRDTNDKGETKLITRTTYQTVSGKRVPQRHEMYELKPDGKKKHWIEIEFTEYTPYTPTANELDLEKQFGVKPLPVEPRPASAFPTKSASRSVSLWYWVAGILLALALLLFVLYRRKSRLNSANS